TILFYLFSILAAQSQWVSQPSGTSSFLRDIEFINRNTGWAVGDNGTILKTINGGTNWLMIANPAVGKPLFSIHIVDSNVCYVVGWFETIIKSTDGGASWIVIRNNGFGFGSSYDAVFFIDENTGWIAGTGQKVLRTTNGGDSIITDPLFAGNLHDMYFKDAMTGIVTGSGTDMFKTINGGSSWLNVTMPIGTRIPDFYKLSFVNNLTGWVAGSDNRVFKTTDFGDTWDSITRIPVSSLTSSMRFAEFIDENTGFVGGEQGYLFKSTNSGMNWMRENSANFPPALMKSMNLYNDSIGWVVGGGGKIINTTNGGQTMVNVTVNENTLPKKFALEQNYPNPFNPETNIKFDLPEDNFVTIKVYDILGKEVFTLLNDFRNAGRYSINFNGSNFASGIYYYKIKAGEFESIRKMILIK
ncbi:MAG: YCF48-related protein, partial [bacterium]|nr:YCF48-related protein [bacterium]